MKDFKKLEEIWAAYVYEGRMDPSVQPAVAECWKKCRDAGMDPNGGLGRRVDDAVFQSIREANSTLIDTALPIMQSIFDIVRRTGFLMVLTDSAGYVLETMGDESIKERTEDLRFVPGALWSNLSVGTNAISVALDCDTPIQMVGPEHYCRTHHGWTCSASPIHGLNGEVIGCFNMSGDASGVHDHTLAVVLAAVYGIEGKLSLLHNAEIMHSALESSADGIVLLSQDDYRAIWMNSAARRLLGLGLEELQGRDFRRLMPDIGWDAMGWRRGSRCFADDSRLITGDGMLHCSVAVTPSMEYDARTLCVTLKKQTHLIDSVNKVSGNRAIYTFQDIYTCDPGMKKTIALARRYARYDGNILIEGESGTGKELFAQSIHNGGRRANAPFVVVNCGALPRNLVQSELFGYDEGSFTGASRLGKPGKFELADGGTLFLDEINSMDPALQAKLLKVLEEKKVRRLGGSRDIPFDVRIVAAVNEKPQKLIREGRLREDLYYRLNVMQIRIPPLRERSGDTVELAHLFIKLYNKEFGKHVQRMSPDLEDWLQRGRWPGNIRELQNVIQNMMLRVGETEEEVTCAHIPAYALEIQPAGDEPQPPSPQGSPRQWDLNGLLRDYQRRLLVQALEQSGGNITRAAASLGIGRQNLLARMKRLDVEKSSGQ